MCLCFILKQNRNHLLNTETKRWRERERKREKIGKRRKESRTSMVSVQMLFLNASALGAITAEAGRLFNHIRYLCEVLS